MRDNKIIKIEGIGNLDATAFDIYNTLLAVPGKGEVKSDIVYFPDGVKTKEQIKAIRENINGDPELQGLLGISYDMAKEELAGIN